MIRKYADILLLSIRARKKFSIAYVKYLYTSNGAYGIIIIKTNALTTNRFILVVIILMLKMHMDESYEYYATEDIELDENLGINESDLVGYDKFEDTEVTSEDFISIENLDFIEENLSKLLTTVNASIPLTFIDESDISNVHVQQPSNIHENQFVCEKYCRKYKRKFFFDEHSKICGKGKGFFFPFTVLV